MVNNYTNFKDFNNIDLFKKRSPDNTKRANAFALISGIIKTKNTLEMLTRVLMSQSLLSSIVVSSSSSIVTTSSFALIGVLAGSYALKKIYAKAKKFLFYVSSCFFRKMYKKQIEELLNGGIKEAIINSKSINEIENKPLLSKTNSSSIAWYFAISDFMNNIVEEAVKKSGGDDNFREELAVVASILCLDSILSNGALINDKEKEKLSDIIKRLNGPGKVIDDFNELSNEDKVKFLKSVSFITSNYSPEDIMIGTRIKKEVYGKAVDILSGIFEISSSSNIEVINQNIPLVYLNFDPRFVQLEVSKGEIVNSDFIKQRIAIKAASHISSIPYFAGNKSEHEFEEVKIDYGKISKLDFTDLDSSSAVDIYKINVLKDLGNGFCVKDIYLLDYGNDILYKQSENIDDKGNQLFIPLRQGNLSTIPSPETKWIKISNNAASYCKHENYVYKLDKSKEAKGSFVLMGFQLFGGAEYEEERFNGLQIANSVIESFNENIESNQLQKKTISKTNVEYLKRVSVFVSNVMDRLGKEQLKNLPVFNVSYKNKVEVLIHEDYHVSFKLRHDDNDDGFNISAHGDKVIIQHLINGEVSNYWIEIDENIEKGLPLRIQGNGEVKTIDKLTYNKATTIETSVCGKNGIIVDGRREDRKIRILPKGVKSVEGVKGKRKEISQFSIKNNLSGDNSNKLQKGVVAEDILIVDNKKIIVSSHKINHFIENWLKQPFSASDFILMNKEVKSSIDQDMLRQTYGLPKIVGLGILYRSVKIGMVDFNINVKDNENNQVSISFNGLIEQALKRELHAITHTEKGVEKAINAISSIVDSISREIEDMSNSIKDSTNVIETKLMDKTDIPYLHVVESRLRDKELSIDALKITIILFSVIRNYLNKTIQIKDKEKSLDQLMQFARSDNSAMLWLSILISLKGVHDKNKVVVSENEDKDKRTIFSYVKRLFHLY